MDRQKIIVIFGIALLSAAGLTWFLYANTVMPKQEKRSIVLAASRDLPVGAMLRKIDLKRVALSANDVPRRAVFTEKEALNRVLLYPVSINEPLTLSKLSGPATVEGIA